MPRRAAFVFYSGEKFRLTTFQQWLSGNDQQRLRRPAMKQLDVCRIDVRGKRTLSEWLTLLAGPHATEHVSELLNFQKIARNHYFDSENAAESRLKETPTLLKIRCRLIDDVLALLARRKRLAAREESHANS